MHTTSRESPPSGGTSSGDDASTPEASEPAPERKGTQDHKWAWCRQKIIWLYWEQNLPLQQVQEIMRREHGLKAT